MRIHYRVAGIAAAALVVGGLGLAPAGVVPSELQTVVAMAQAGGKVYTTNDANPALERDLTAAVQSGATILHLCASYSDEGTVDIPAGLTEIDGWQAQSMLFDEGLKLRQIGYSARLNINFVSGATTTVDHVEFYAGGKYGQPIGAMVTVKAGANVTFKNCKFSNTPVIEEGAKANFENCTFATQKIEDHSFSATFSGGTSPANTVQYSELGCASKPGVKLDSAQTGKEYASSVSVFVMGSKHAAAEVSATVDDAGLAASLQKVGETTLEGAAATEYTLTVSGTPVSTHDVKALVEAKTTKPGGTEDRVTLEHLISVYVPLSITPESDSFAPVLEGRQIADNKIPFRLSGTFAGSAQVKATVSDAGYGVRAEVAKAGSDYVVSLSGTPIKGGDLTVTLEASAQRENGITDVVTKDLSLKVADKIAARLEGTLPALEVGTMVPDGTALDVMVAEGSKPEVTLASLMQADPQAQATVVVDPQLSGVTASIVAGKLVISGTPSAQGTYNIHVDVTDGMGRMASTADVTLQVNEKAPKAYNMIIFPATVTQGESAVFSSDADFSLFQSVKVDGNMLPADSYTAESGSTKVTLSGAFTQALPTGNHTLEIVSRDGSATASFAVRAAAVAPGGPAGTTTTTSQAPAGKATKKSPLPQTSDVSLGVAAVAGIATVGLASAGAGFAFRRKVER